jgi:hypothetical protein
MKNIVGDHIPLYILHTRTEGGESRYRVIVFKEKLSFA